jgi:hypothetical protein
MWQKYKDDFKSFSLDSKGFVKPTPHTSDYILLTTNFLPLK